MTTVKLQRSNDKTTSIYEISAEEHAGNKFVCFAISMMIHTIMRMTKEYARSSIIEPGKVLIRYEAAVTDDRAYTIYKFMATAISMLEEDFPECVRKG